MGVLRPATQGGPITDKNEATMGKKAREGDQNDIMLKCGKGMSSAPVWMGKKKLPNAANGAVVSTRRP